MSFSLFFLFLSWHLERTPVFFVLSHRADYSNKTHKAANARPRKEWKEREKPDYLIGGRRRYEINNPCFKGVNIATPASTYDQKARTRSMVQMAEHDPLTLWLQGKQWAAIKKSPTPQGSPMRQRKEFMSPLLLTQPTLWQLQSFKNASHDVSELHKNPPISWTRSSLKLWKGRSGSTATPVSGVTG